VGALGALAAVLGVANLFIGRGAPERVARALVSRPAFCAPEVSPKDA
jgi:hypothetical protein